MPIILRPYQQSLREAIYAAWEGGARNVLAVSATGSGKTVLMADILHSHRGESVTIAHRAELVSQISLSLARNGVMHSLIASKSTVRNVIALHMAELGRHWYDPSAPCRVASVHTLVRLDPTTPWLRRCTLWVTDECHHLVQRTIWGKAVAMLPIARGLGLTATPCRSDGLGLGSHTDGVFDVMVLGPPMRDLITAGYLTDYRVYCPPSSLDLSGVRLSASGDYSPAPLRAAVHKASITGDVVGHYRRITPGALGVTFAVDIEAATEITEAYRSAGVPAEIVTGKTPDTLRAAILRRFRAREVLQLVNVDLFGEGFDLPGIEVVSFARPTQSYALYAQQFGRSLRPLPGKSHATIIDHVGNVARHGLPDRPRVWSLDRRESRGASRKDTVPVRVCPACTLAYERVHVACPYCGHAPEPAGRSRPEQVDGDLHLLSPDALAAMRGEIERIDGAPVVPFGAPPAVVGAVRKQHHRRQQAQGSLREAMALWGGADGRTGREREAQREFYFRHGVDVLTAQTLGAKDAAALEAAVRADLGFPPMGESR